MNYPKMLKDLREKSVKLMQACTKLARKKELCEKLDKLQEGLDWWHGEDAIHVSYWIGVDTFKDEKLISLMTKIEELTGEKFNASSDYLDTGLSLREFRLKGDYLRISINANLSGQSANCVKVQIGEETVPKFEIRCSE